MVKFDKKIIIFLLTTFGECSQMCLSIPPANAHVLLLIYYLGMKNGEKSNKYFKGIWNFLELSIAQGESNNYHFYLRRSV